MGKEMEDAGNEWRCPTCKKKEKAEAAHERPKNDLEQKLEAKLQKENEKQLQKEKRLSHKGTGTKKKVPGNGQRKRPGSAMSNDGKEEKVTFIYITHYINTLIKIHQNITLNNLLHLIVF